MTVSLALGALAFARPAHAEVDVSVTLSGDIDEIIAVLVQLRNLGIGENIAAQAEDPLRLHVHSIAVGSLDDPPADAEQQGASGADRQAEAPQPAEPEQPAAPPPPPTPNLADATVEPTTAAPGQPVTVTVAANDPDHAIDTVAVEFDTPAPLMRDLYDTGTEGDAQAGDGVWSRRIVLPPDLASGEYTGRIVGFDINGEPLTARTGDGEPRRVQTGVTLTVAEPAEG
jgi:hypothetical protein